MAKVKVTSIPSARTKIIEWGTGVNIGNELIYDMSGPIEGKDMQLWAFNTQNVLVDIQEEVGPFKKIVFVSVV